MRDRESTARRREIGYRLRRLREKAELRIEDLARTLGWSITKVSRTETGTRGITEVEVVHFAAQCGATHHQVNYVLGMCRELEVPGYWLTDRLSSLIYHESSAKFSASYDPLVVPGLLQTEDYANALMMRHGDKPHMVGRLVNARMERQGLLLTRSFDFFVHEQALRLRVGGNQLMHAQLLKLVLMAEHPLLNIRVVPLSAGEASMFGGEFVLFHYKHAPPLVAMAGAGASVYIEEAVYLAEYHRILTRLGQVALDAGQSREMFAELASAYEQPEDSHDAHDRMAKEQL